jgi:hypothetical protein
MEISPDDEKRVWGLMQNSPFQRVVHNELVDSIHRDLLELEKCELGDVPAIRMRMQARRELLGFLHRTDKTTKPNPAK